MLVLTRKLGESIAIDDHIVAHAHTFIVFQFVPLGVSAQNLGCIGSHRAVEINGKTGRDALFVLEGIHEVHDFLGAPHCETWNDEAPMSLYHPINDLGQFVQRVVMPVQSVAIGGFHDDHIRLGDGGGWKQKTRFITSYIAGKYDGFAVAIHLP